MDIDKRTQLNEEQRRFLLRYYSRLPLSQQIDILNNHRRILYMQKGTNENISYTSYISLVLAIKSYIAIERKLATKKFDEMSLEEIRTLSILKIKKFKARQHKKRTKGDKVLGLWAIIRTLRSEDISFREISIYLKKHHHLVVGHSLIHKMWNEIEGNVNG